MFYHYSVHRGSNSVNVVNVIYVCPTMHPFVIILSLICVLCHDLYLSIVAAPMYDRFITFCSRVSH